MLLLDLRRNLVICILFACVDNSESSLAGSVFIDTSYRIRCGHTGAEGIQLRTVRPRAWLARTWFLLSLQSSHCLHLNTILEIG